MKHRDLVALLTHGGLMPSGGVGASLALVAGVPSAAQDTGIADGMVGFMWGYFDADVVHGRFRFSNSSGVTSAATDLPAVANVFSASRDRAFYFYLDGSAQFFSVRADVGGNLVWRAQRVDAGELLE